LLTDRTETRRDTRVRGKALNLAIRATASLLLAALLSTDLVFAQRPYGGGLRRHPGQRQGKRLPGLKKRRGKDTHPHPPGFFEHLRELPPEEQERVIANDQRFHTLPPERQEMIRERLRRWNALSPEQKDRIRQREEIFESLSPTQREEARAIFQQQWSHLEPGRRFELMQAFRQLRGLPPGERQRFLSSPQVQKRFSPEERNILEGLGRLLPASRANPSVRL
jgi:hypothetical protein